MSDRNVKQAIPYEHGALLMTNWKSALPWGLAILVVAFFARMDWIDGDAGRTLIIAFAALAVTSLARTRRCGLLRRGT